MTEHATNTWRYKLGLILFFGAFPVFFATPIVVGMLGLSAMDSAALIGGVLLVVEILWVISIPLLGKEGFKEVKAKAFGWIKLPEGPVSQSRHRAGVWLLVGSILLDALIALAIVGVDLFMAGASDPTTTILGLSFKQQATIYVTVQILTTLGVIAGMLMLGSEFWERIKEAFEWHPDPALTR